MKRRQAAARVGLVLTALSLAPIGRAAAADRPGFRVGTLDEPARIDAGLPRPCAQLAAALTRDEREGLLWAALRDAEECVEDENASPVERAAGAREAGRIRLLAGDATGAAAALRSALKTAPDDARASYLLAQASRDNPEEALPHAERAARRAAEPRLRAAAERLTAEIRLDLGDRRGARKALERALKRDPRDLDALALLTRAESDNPRRAAAVATRATEAAAAVPGWLRPSAERARARIWLQLDDAQNAASALRAALAADPDDLDALEALVEVRRRWPRQPVDASEAPARDPAPAAAATEEDLRTAAAEAADRLPALSRLVEFELARGSAAASTDAASKFTDAIGDAPEWQRAAAGQWIARVWLALGDAKLARQCLRRSRDYDWRSFAASSAFAAAGIPEEAPPIAQTLVSLAHARAELGDAAGAERRLARALELDPGSAAVLEVLRILAQTALDEGRLKDAETYWGRLDRGLGDDADPRLRAAARRLDAAIRDRRGDASGARRELRRALDESPDDLDALAAISESPDTPAAEALALVEKRRPKDDQRRGRWLGLRGAAKSRAGDAAGAESDLAAALEFNAHEFCFGDGVHSVVGPLGPEFFDRCLARFPDSAALRADRGIAL